MEVARIIDENDDHFVIGVVLVEAAYLHPSVRQMTRPEVVDPPTAFV